MDDYILEKDNPSNFKFYNHPVFYDFEKYEQARELFVSIISSSKDVDSIYQIGNISSPGISDIDIIIVLRDKVDNISSRKYSIKQLGYLNQYLFNHEPVLISKEVARYIQLLFPIFKIEKLYGDDVDFDTTINEIKYKIINYINIISLFYPREILGPLFKNKIDVRGLLCRLNLLSYIFKDITKLTGDNDPKFSKYISDIFELRSKWFKWDNGKYDLLVRILEEALPLTLRTISNFTNYLREKRIVKLLSTPRDNYFITSAQTLFFLNNWTEELSLRNSLRLYRKTRIVGSFLPLELMILLVKFTNVKRIQEKINRAMKYSDIQFQSDYLELINRRQQIIDKHLLLFEKNGYLFLNLGILYLIGVLPENIYTKTKGSIKKLLVNLLYN